MAEPTIKKQNSTNIRESPKGKSSKISTNSNKEKNAINHTKTLSVLVSAFLKGENFEITLPMLYQEKIYLTDLFIELKGQDLSVFEQNCWRVYYGKGWVNKLPKGDYQVRFAAYLKDRTLEKETVKPTFFIRKELIENSLYQKFNQTKIKMNELATNYYPKDFFILADVPSVDSSKRYINLILEGLSYSEMR